MCLQLTLVGVFLQISPSPTARSSSFVCFDGRHHQELRPGDRCVDKSDFKLGCVGARGTLFCRLCFLNLLGISFRMLKLNSKLDIRRISRVVVALESERYFCRCQENEL